MVELWRNNLGIEEAQAAYDAVITGCVSDGKIVNKLEEKISVLLNVPYVIAAPNGTSALLLSLIAAGIEPGDEVIVPDITFIATANAAKILGAKVIVADTEKEAPVINYEHVMELISDKTRVVMPVHINGHRADTQKLKKELAEKNILVIDDACQAFMSGQEGNFAGNDADMACYSLGITKIAASGQGGFVTTHSKELYDKMKIIKTQGLESIFECNKYERYGFNFKMSDILASVGIVQLNKMKEKTNYLWEIYELYKLGLKEIEGIEFIGRRNDELPWMPYILCEKRNNLRELLEKNDIMARPIGTCLHRAMFLEKSGQYDNALFFESHILALPGGPNQPVENIKKIIEIIQQNNEYMLKGEKYGLC